LVVLKDLFSALQLIRYRSVRPSLGLPLLSAQEYLSEFEICANLRDDLLQQNHMFLCNRQTGNVSLIQAYKYLYK
jgi:hypothetical protein